LEAKVLETFKVVPISFGSGFGISHGATSACNTLKFGSGLKNYGEFGSGGFGSGLNDFEPGSRFKVFHFLSWLKI
jgi:hypothetical protein